LEILCPIAERIGSKVGKSLVQKHPEFKDDVEAVGQLIDMVERTMLGRMGGSRPLSNDEFVREITECPMLVFSPPEMCKQTEAFYQGICRSIDPDLEFHYEKMMSAGDDICLWSLRRKSASPPKEEKEISRTSQTPLEVLKMRLAKGEVTKQEYEELRELLSK
jgi:predicted ArsR family transcriptional regulator